MAVLFNLNLSRSLFLEQVVYLDLLLCKGFYLQHADLFLCFSFTNQMIERLSIAMTTAWVCNVLLNQMKITSHCPNL